jgi:hypothetical protein
MQALGVAQLNNITPTVAYYENLLGTTKESAWVWVYISA